MAALRRAIRGIEGRHVEADLAASLLPLGVVSIDAALGGGLARGALHEVAALTEADLAAATGFGLALAARAAGSTASPSPAAARAIVWVAEEFGLGESGAPYGPGLLEAGLAPERVVTVTAARAQDVLWAMEEALRCRAVGAVVGELRKNNALDAVAGRRLSLAAHQHHGFALLLRPRPDARPLAAATRWSVGAAPSAPLHHGLGHGTGPPVIAVRLARNRHGPTGSWVLEWQRAEQRYAERIDLAAAHPQPVAEAPADRPRRATARA